MKPKLKAIKQAATKIYEDINGPFQELFGMSFAKVQTKTPGLCLQEKKSQAELQKQRREKLRAEKKQMEEHWSNRDCETMLATKQTYIQRQEQRLALFFETSEDAENCQTERLRRSWPPQKKTSLAKARRSSRKGYVYTNGGRVALTF